MLCLLGYVVLGLLPGPLPPAATLPQHVRATYHVSIDDPADETVTVRLELDGLTNLDPPLERLTLSLPAGFAFARLPEPLLEGLFAEAVGKDIPVRSPRPFHFELEPGEHDSILLGYDVPLVHRGLDEVRGRDEYEYPYLMAGHGFLVTATLFPTPDGIDVERWSVVFDLPAGWDVLAPWPRRDDGSFDPGSPAATSNDLVAIGPWDTATIELGDFRAEVAVAPGQGALKQAVVGPITEIVAYQLELFGLPPEGRYLFLFGRPDTPGMAGSPKTNSMTLSVGSDVRHAAGDFIPHLIAHEFFHTWGARVGALDDDLRWLQEGITEYYANLVLARLGITDLSTFNQSFVQRLASVEANPAVARLSLAEAGGPAFFEGGEAYSLVYDGGFLVGAWLDRMLRRAQPATSLDQLMRRFLNETPDDRRPLKLATLSELVAELAGPDCASGLAAVVEEPLGSVSFVEWFATAGLDVRRSVLEREISDRSLRANFDGTCVSAIDPSGLGFLLGLRQGDCVRIVNGTAIEDERDIRAAWPKLTDGKVRLEWTRADETLRFEGELPKLVRYESPAEAWRAHLD